MKKHIKQSIQILENQLKITSMYLDNEPKSNEYGLLRKTMEEMEKNLFAFKEQTKKFEMLLTTGAII